MSTERHELTSRLAEMDEMDELAEKFQKQNPGTSLVDEFRQKRIPSTAREWLLSSREWKEFQRSQIQTRLDAIRNPHGMERELLIFVVYSILGVLVPLFLIPYETTSHSLFLTVKWTILGLMAIYWAFVYYYLFYLFRWKHREVVSRWREYFQTDRDKTNS